MLKDGEKNAIRNAKNIYWKGGNAWGIVNPDGKLLY